MSEYNATVFWERNGQKFTDNRYNRSHEWHFDGGKVISASSSPQVVPVPLSNPAAVDPEEAFIVSLSSCHMLWFLSIAAKRGFIVDNYRDKAEGVIKKDASGRLAITEVTLNPRVIYAGGACPGAEEDTAIHHEAHEQCFIANSVRTTITIQSTMEITDADE